MRRSSFEHNDRRPLQSLMPAIARGWLILLGGVALVQSAAGSETTIVHAKTTMETIRVSRDGHHFVLSESKTEFRPWGFNYDHDAKGRLLEDYWKEQWNKVEADFKEMKALGANVARVHLQVGKFMNSAKEPNSDSLQLLVRLVFFVERIGLFLFLSGLCV